MVRCRLDCVRAGSYHICEVSHIVLHPPTGSPPPPVSSHIVLSVLNLCSYSTALTKKYNTENRITL